MKSKSLFTLGFIILHSSFYLPARAQSVNQSSEPIPMSEVGAKAGAQYHGDGLSVAPTPEGARLGCVFQKLEGQVTREGLWLTSTAENSNGGRFRVVASEVGRVTPCAPGLDPSANGAHGVTRPTLMATTRKRSPLEFSAVEVSHKPSRVTWPSSF